MKKIIFSLSLLAFAGTSFSQTVLKGFYYGQDKAPGGHEWQSPDSLAYNKEQPKAIFYAFESLDKAKLVLPENSNYWMSLDGVWKFHWVNTPDKRPVDFYKPDYNTSGWDDINVPSNWNIAGLQPDGTKKYGTPIYVNQPVIFYHKVAPGDWKGGVMRTPPENWTTFEDRNEVGSYRRSFTVPDDWNGREVYINFDGVDSFFYLWINGQYVGFSKNSRNAAVFDITPYILKGENVVAVEVYRSSDGSFLEAQDMFRLPGIFRSVSLYSTNKIQIRDFKVIPDLTNDYQDGELTVSTQIRNLSEKNSGDLKLNYKLFANKLYSDDHEPGIAAEVVSGTFNIAKGGEGTEIATIKVANPNKWSAEQPWRYTLVAQLVDKKGKVLETVSTYVGFRKVELKDTDAKDDEFGLPGRYFYVNGQPVKLKGVNRHETNALKGHAISREDMEKEVMLMKRANINHVRNSHYPDNPYWYYLTDKYGIYLEDEANLESHEYYYGDASLSHVPEFLDAHVARNMEMVHSRVNSPSVVIWSLGNEAGPGENFVVAYNAIKEFDTSRPVQYERNNDIVDIGSNQYPSIKWVEEAVQGKMDIKYPFHISEYAHSMGNAVGNLVDYWNAIESTNHFMGGAIWDWIDQSLYYNDPVTGDRYLAFGGDFGDTPTDGQFVMNGIIFGDYEPKPQYWEVKKVYQNAGVSPVDIENGKIEVFNKNYFTPLDNYTLEWSLLEDGVPVKTGKLSPESMNIGPREKKTLSVPYSTADLKPESEYFLNVSLLQNEATPWAEAGYEQMAEQLPVKAPAITPATTETGKLQSTKNGNIQTITGKDFKVEFDTEKGTFNRLTYGGKDVVTPGNGPVLDLFRAYLNNDNWIADQWFANGLYNLKHKVTSSESQVDKDGNQVLIFTIESQAPNGGKMKGGNGNAAGVYTIEEIDSVPFGPDNFKVTTNQVWTVFPDGTIELNSYITSNNQLLTLPRMGYTLEVPDEFGTFTYYGRGPEENYADRKTGQFVGKYSAPVKDMYTDYTRPQSNGNREEVRWAALTDGNQGVMFIAPELMSASALPYTEMQLFEANHPYKLQEKGSTTLHLDLGVTGLGGASCGQGGPLDPDRVKADGDRFTLIIKPVNDADLSKEAKVSPNGYKPLGMTRDRKGTVTLDYPENVEILYSIDGAKKPSTYTEPINLRKGGTIKAWLKDNPAISSTENYSFIEAVPLIPIYASSQEPEDGEASFLVDRDPSSIWHTMYSVTVAQYPHWVDFDAGEQQMIKSVSYLPRQDWSRTGDIKDYEIYISDSPDNWGEPVAKGSFDRSKEKKTITFEKPVKGRYIRLRALSSQDGREYASGAEFEVIGDTVE
ncbi:MAG: DUF4981 domain-containing protein [Muribaculaceae bacterium]|nr:DUF4981 domain-containing protein [Muribaculaceae bacterium]